MSWVWVGVGAAVGATAGAISGSRTGGDDVWKQALGGAALGGAAGGAGYAALGAEAAAPAVAAEAVPAAGIMGAEGAAAAGGSGLALGGAGLETGGAMAGGAGILGAEAAGTAGTTATAGGMGTSAGGMGLGQAGGFAGTEGAAFGGSGASFGSTGSAAVPQGGGLLNAPGQAMGFNQFGQAPIQMAQTPAASSDLAMVEASPQGDSINGVQTGANKTGYSLANQSPLEKGFGSAMSWLSEPKNAMLTGVLGLGALSMFNNNNEDNFGNSNVTPAGYPLSPNFKPSRYQPTRQYASGGITDAGAQNKIFPQSQIPDRTQFAVPTQMPASMEVLRSDYDSTISPYTGDETRFKTGGSASDNSDKAFAEARRYQGMIDPRMNVQTPDTPDWVRSRGIYTDNDPDTKYQDALTAAQTRMGKAASRANVKLGAMQKPTPMGKLNLGPVVNNEKQKANTAEDDGLAGGGIASLGGYAHGGNPRLLRGPGDGMSDDIPATIADKQPARLADGEFVVPADVVSGLGNGSTEAGAKKLHQMMDKVRVDRTGTKKQGKQINADNYVPGAKAEKKAAGGIAGYADGGDVDYSQYYVYDAQGNQIPMSTLLSAPQAQTTPVSPTANTTSQGYNPDYYNIGHYQSKLPGLQEQLKSFEGQKVFDPTYYLAQNPDIAADRYWSQNPFQHYQEYGIKEGRSPFEGGQAGQQLLDVAAQQTAQQQLQDAQSNINRLQNTTIKYDPYTIANRPSAAEPQFYGNIYRGSTPDYATPGYTLSGGNLGQWNNVAGEAARAAQPASMNQQVTQAYLQNLGRAPETTGFNYWMNSGLTGEQVREGIANSPESKNIKARPKSEEKKRKGGILAASK